MKVYVINIGNGRWVSSEEFGLNVDSVEEVFDHVMRDQEYSRSFYVKGYFKIIAHIEDDDGNVLYSIGDYGVKTLQRLDLNDQ